MLFASANAQFPTIYASTGTGTWATVGTWETFTGNITNTPGAQGSGTAAASAPSGTHHIYIRAGHTVTMGASKNMMGLTIEPTGSLLAGGSFTLKPGNGGTGFTGPNSVTITNNGTLGSMTDVLVVEVPIAAGNVTFTGSGIYLLGRLRIVGGNPSSPVVTINQNLTLQQSANYALSAVYNPQATDNYTITINSGKTVTITNTAGYFHSNSMGSGTGFGTYTYNINGTLDLSASTQIAANLSAISPTAGTVNLNINGALKTGAAFNSSPVAPGIGNISVANGVVVDATLATVMNFNSNSFTLAGTGAVKRTVLNDGTKTRLPVGTAFGSENHVIISGDTGPTDIFNAGVKNTFTNAAPANTLPREWNISEAVAGGNADTLRFEWNATDVGASGFSSVSPVYIARWNGTGYDFTMASITGTGTDVDPYVAKGSGFSSFGLFVLTNSSLLPVSLVNVSAYQKQLGVQIEFGNATELDVLNYEIEKSVDGRLFETAGTLLPKTNNGNLNSYQYFDASPNRGVNFYRIKATERNGTIKYSSILKVNLLRNGYNVTIYPNPVKGNQFSIQLENLDKAVYSLSLMNEVGQVVYNKTINHDGRTATFTVDLPTSLKKGIYNLQLNNNQQRINKSLIIE